ncbi:hypothetical protein [Roseisolibacter sp. H3M3-2]|uniref:hypothetical protein n=1 Tax=Roseisolibacter sp. H3M3-2 TaxID=3031323 RepID=UPI0023DAE326|nr:hypothetical protein [Roseisolibacter sp. H3M3-2]MDF1502953.1 hypothetical protein [Roseisolibacter sp. H3M3-2]
MHEIRVNRAPVLTLWGAVVAERLGHGRAAALTLGGAVAGLNAQSKGRRLGIVEPRAERPAARKKPAAARGARRRERLVPLLGRTVPAVDTPRGLRAVEKGRPTTPTGVERYLRGKFGEALPEVRAAMEALAAAYEPDALEAKAFALYERFRPAIPAGTRGWGAKGVLDLDLVRALAER